MCEIIGRICIHEDIYGYCMIDLCDLGEEEL